MFALYLLAARQISATTNQPLVRLLPVYFQHCICRRGFYTTSKLHTFNPITAMGTTKHHPQGGTTYTNESGTEWFVQDGVTTCPLFFLNADELYNFANDPCIDAFSTKWVPLGTRVVASDVVTIGTRSFVGLGNGTYVTRSKDAAAPAGRWAKRSVSASTVCVLFTLFVVGYMAVVFPIPALIVTVGFAMAVKCGLVGYVVRQWIANPSCQDFSLYTPFSPEPYHVKI
jgi:hypothetical protein